MTGTWYDIFTNLNNAPEDYDIRKRLSVWHNRCQYYQDIHWQNKNKLNREGRKLQEALIAWDELKSESDIDDIKLAILGVINIQLLKIENTQLRILEKTQGLKRRPTAKEYLKLINDQREKANIVIESKKGKDKFSIRISTFQNSPGFFKTREKKIHFTRHFDRADAIAEGLNVANAFNNLSANIANISAFFMRTMTNASAILNTIPFINAITTAIPILIQAVNRFRKNSSLTKRIFSGILLGVIIGGIIMMGVTTVAATGIAAGLMAIGIYVKHVHPWLLLRKDIYQKKRELKLLEKTPLTEALTKTYTAKFNKRAEEETLEPKTFEENIEQRKKDLKEDLADLAEKESLKRRKVINGVFAVAGAILICIPTPPTLLLGAALLLTTTLITVAIRFRWADKIKSLFVKKAKEPQESFEQQLPKTLRMYRVFNPTQKTIQDSDSLAPSEVVTTAPREEPVAPPAHIHGRTRRK